MPEYKLYYFPIRGRGEVIRYILHYAEVPFEDVHVLHDPWISMKETTPMGQLPVLEVDGRKLCQSLSICRYLAKEHNLTGTTVWENAMCDMYVDGVMDLYTSFRPVLLALFAKDAEKQAENYKKFKTENLPGFMQRYEKFLAENETDGWLVGNKVTWADIVVAEFLDRLEKCFDSEVFEGYPCLKEHSQRVHDLPGIKRYSESRIDMKL